MSAGRPTKFKLASPNSKGAWRETLVVGSDDRMRVSNDIVRRIPWLSPGSEILAILWDANTVELRSGDDIEKIERTISDMAVLEGEEREEEELAYRTVFLRLRVNTDPRVVIPKEMRLCLGLDPIEPGFVTLTIRRASVYLTLGSAEDFSIAAGLIDLTDSEMPSDA